ncbi:MAG: glycosyltransferase family 4 protein, partial [Candidatus Helarchaeota archaeon]
TLTLIGSGYQKESLDALAKRFMVDVKFLGRVDHQDLPYNLNKADVFVLPSFNEGMSNSVLEAMGCGLPIIITATGGAEELINGNGTIVHKHNVKALRETILKYLKYPKKITEEGKVSRQIAEKMSWQSVSEDYIKIYRTIIDETTGAQPR